MIIGAGPYALSLAAHLAEQGASFRIFGAPMHYWRRHMPLGMMLKSDGFASNLSAPGEGFTLGDYCRRQGVAYHDTDIPISLADFTAYALEFQSRFVPTLETKLVERVETIDGGFRVRLDDGEELTARRVVTAVGIGHFAHVPDVLAGLPGELVSHSSAHHALDAFKGREVTVLGAGASAVGLAALLHEAEASVRLVARVAELHFSSAPTGRPPSLWRRLRRPKSGMGPGWKSRLLQDAPHLFRRLPDPLRLDVVRRHLGPSSAYYLKDRVLGRVPLVLGRAVGAAERNGDKLKLVLEAPSGDRVRIETGHVIAATGFRPDLKRLPFLSEPLRERIRTVGNAPALSAAFESSVPGLYFLGPVAANSFGPMMRFMFGSDWAARRLSRRLTRAQR